MMIRCLTMLAMMMMACQHSQPVTVSEATVSPQPLEATSQVARVGGQYIVQKIEKISPKEFKIILDAKVTSGRFDQLTLVSNHIHVGIREGQELKVSAEILKDEGAKAEVSQLLVFLPRDGYHAPVWLLSSRVKHEGLKGAKFIDMHAPETDYSIL